VPVAQQLEQVKRPLMAADGFVQPTRLAQSTPQIRQRPSFTAAIADHGEQVKRPLMAADGFVQPTRLAQSTPQIRQRPSFTAAIADHGEQVKRPLMAADGFVQPTRLAQSTPQIRQGGRAGWIVVGCGGNCLPTRLDRSVKVGNCPGSGKPGTKGDGEVRQGGRAGWIVVGCGGNCCLELFYCQLKITRISRDSRPR
jgi:hypothetical protein